MTLHYGASPEDWTHFDLILGVGEDLLPVVSNPDAEISPQSTMKGKGKTPSRYNKKRLIAGFPKWTEHKATPKDLTTWSEEEDYGICIQTRDIRAIDIDVENELEAERIRTWFNNALAIRLPCRMRANSGKRLLVFRLAGNHPKRVVKVDGGMVEFLMNGQQFIACGTHTSGARYEWEGGLPNTVPEVVEFDSIVDAFAAEFGIEPVSTGTALRNRPTIEGALPDETYTYLEEHGLVHGYGSEGQAFLSCPFEYEHTTPAGESDFAYFAKGTRGYPLGSFKCMHAHCAARSTNDFLDAIGIRTSVFDVIEDEHDAQHVEENGSGRTVAVKKKAIERPPLPRFKRDKNGEIYAIVGNVKQALLHAQTFGWDIRFDSFRDEIIISRDNCETWRAISDEDYFHMRVSLEEIMFQPVGTVLIREAVYAIAKDKRFDSATHWLNSLPAWDGVSRMGNFLHTYLGADDTEYTRAVSSYIWSALAGRVLVPGIKADMVPILEGAQGIRKSSIVAAMAPAREMFCELSLAEKDDDLSRKMRGKLVAELSEIRMNAREMEWLKAFASRTHETWVPKYKEFGTDFPRRLLLLGTTNQKQFLYDESGNRRWLPVHVRAGDVAAVERDRLQLWAEARDFFELCGGIDWSAEKLAEGVHEQYRVDSVWEEQILAWLDTPGMDGICPRNMPQIYNLTILSEACHVVPKSDRGQEIRDLGKVMRRLGFESNKLRTGPRYWFWPVGGERTMSVPCASPSYFADIS